MTTTPAARDERELFESAYLKEYFYPAERWSLVPEKYRTEHADIAWRAWQTRAALAESELAEVREQNEVFEGGMRALACSLSAGGYNSEKLTAAQLLEKVTWGIDEFTKSTCGLLDSVRAERDELRAELERVKLDAQRYQVFRSTPSFGTSFGTASTPEQIDKLCDAAIDAARGVEG